MKSKYVLIRGLAFSEEGDMKRLEDYARKGWILEGISGIFYKLRKDKPQNITYSLDYQTEADAEYFSIFKEAGWKLVVSADQSLHIFSAPLGTKPIYSDGESEMDKYTTMIKDFQKGTIVSAILAVPLIAFLVYASNLNTYVSAAASSLLLLDFMVFIFNFMPLLAFRSRVRQIQKFGRCKEEVINRKSSWILSAVAGILWLAVGIWNLTGKLYISGAFLVIFGIFFVFKGFINYKGYKESSK